MGSYHFYIVLLFCVWSYSNAFYASDINKYLPKKYGSELGVKGLRYGGGVKGKPRGGVKTKQTIKPPTLDLLGGAASPAYEGGCTQLPEKPPHGKLRCSFYSGCSLSCERGYKLPGDAYATYILCENGKWVSQGTETGELPSCQPDCSPPCQNQGICIAPDQCNCPDQFSGPQCQFENKPCMELPPPPQNSRRTCRKEQEYCTVTCLKGHQFPDESTVATLTCKNGLWVPGRDDWVTIPDCQATCSKPCQNGGICLSLDICQCPQNFRGPQCQYGVDACTSSKLNFNGGLKCSGDSEKFVCSGLYCAEGMKISHDPAPSYTCKYSEGVFYPTDVPTCTFESPGMTLELHQSSSHTSHNEVRSSSSQNDDESDEKEATSIVIENKLPTPGVCYTWGGVHYKTFDGRLYSFDSHCAHTLVKDSADNTFSITVQNSDSCYTSDNLCSRILNFYIQGRDYKLNLTDDGNPLLTQGSSVLPIPGQAVGIRTEMTAQYIHVLLDSIGISLKWDTKTLVQVDTRESLWNRTEGLCGNIDGNLDNDVITKSGRQTKNVVTAASSWQVDDLGVHCPSSPMEQRACPGDGVKGSLSSKAHEFCTQLLSDSRFIACSSVLDRSLLIQACAWDYCNCKSEEKSDCACDTMNVYVSACKQKGLTTLANWRDASTCPLKCSGGKVYQSCGPSKGQPICGSSGTSLAVDSKTCEEGCFCPEGKVLHNNVCIPVSKCPCRLRKKEFPAGSSVPKDCNTCVCENGHWTCTQISCGARCSAIGDPHYTTFDGKKYDFMGKCSYYLIQGRDFSIETENVACPGAISEMMSFAKTSTAEMPSCTKTATIKLNGTITIKLRQNNDVLVNGQEVTNLPLESSGFTIRTISSIFLLVELPNGLQIWWDGTSRIYVDMPASFKEQTKGLCGTFNRNQKDDFSTPEGDVEQSVISFANKWKTHEACANVPNVIPSHPCEVNMHRKANAEKLCSQIKSDLFTDCHFYVDPEPYYHDCLYDVCSCQGDLNKCLCTIIASYSHECASKGIVVDWRGHVKECGIQCPASQKYQVCGDSCTRSCYDISTRNSCTKQCVEGCNCPNGEALDDDGECIPVGQCKCYANGIIFNPGYKEIRRIEQSPDLCACVNGGWHCGKASVEDMKLYPDAADLKSMCNSSLHLEFTSCEPAEPRTCKNMDSYQRSSTAICHPGCACKDGFVLDPITKKCIIPSDCPCHHGGRSYRENDVVQNDCNTCNCKAGKWSCTNRQCAAECSAWGDSHYKTFDGKHYDYQGQCDYVLAKGSLGDLAAFDISIQNVPCGSLGTSCSKSISIRVGTGKSTESLTLSVGKPLPKSTTFGHLTVREIGLYVIIEAPDLGLTVRWDRGTRVYVRLNPKWKNQVKGLCGNYNDNEMDDFQTPSGGVTEVSPYAFGDSWKLEPYCPEAKEITDTCKEKPERRVWAMRKCGILKSSVFMPCHSEVPIDSFYEKCLFDTCACDQGGDCECLCTALAAYAQECNNRGVPIHWRSQDLCPIQCNDQCSAYKPCMSTCLVETCDNIYTRGKISATCGEDTCVEGCEVKTCPVGQVYFNSSSNRCIPVNECKSVCMEINGVTYYEGDVIEEDSCHTCYCSRGQKNCKGKPCTQVPISTTTPASRDETVKCVTGWTEWINHNPLPEKGGVKTRPKEVEPLPTAFILNNLLSGGKCSPDMMTDIRCRTVRGKISSKETGLDAECSLERGLVCKSNRKGAGCPDFEIQVYCQCGTTSTSTTTAKITPTDATVSESFVITGQPKCNLHTRKRVHDGDCYKYYVCQDGPKGIEYVEQTCGRTMMFNPKTLSCDLIDTVSLIRPECAPSTTTTTTTSYVTITVKPQCNSDMPNKVHEIDCHKFYACENGPNGPEYVEQICKGTMMYNPNTFGCDRPNVVSSIRPECEITTTTSVPTVIPSETTATEVFVITGKPSCNSETPNKAHESDCHKYYVCNDGPNGPEYVLQTCGSTMMYNPKTLSCDRLEVVSAIRPECADSTTSTTTPSTPTTIKQTTGISFITITAQPECNSRTPDKPHDIDCHKFYMCRNGPNGPEYVEQTCGSSLMYNPKTFSCDRIEVVTLIRPECADSTTATSYVTITAKPQCNSEMTNKPHENDCHKYYVCENTSNGPNYAEKICGGTMMYNPNTFGCDRQDIVSGIRPECASTTTSTSTTTPAKTTATESFVITAKPRCNSERPNKPHENDCHKYYVCNDGPNGPEYVEQTCGITMMYNPKTLSCDRIESVSVIRPECAVPTTSTPTTTTRRPSTTALYVTMTEQPHCTSDMKNHQHASDCHKYYVCENGPNGPEYVLQICKGTTMYNPNTYGCDRRDVVSTIRPECAASTTTTTRPAETTATEVFVITGKPSCNSETPNKPHESDCHKYYVCNDGPNGPEYVLQTCGSTMMYNPKTLSCDRLEVVSAIRPECEISTSTTTTTKQTTTAATVTSSIYITGQPECNSQTLNRPHKDDCRKFYTCENGPNGAEYVEQTCEGTMLYNPKTFSCDTVEIVRTIRPECDTRCKRGMKYSDCAIDCRELCLFFDYTLRSSGICVNEYCEPGCVDDKTYELKVNNKCSRTHKWANNNTCIDMNDCMCVSYNGKPVKPGAVHKESDCKVCQCIQNYYVCDESACTLKPKHTTAITYPKTNTVVGQQTTRTTQGSSGSTVHRTTAGAKTTSAVTEVQTAKITHDDTSNTTKQHVSTSKLQTTPFVIVVNTETPPPSCLFQFIPLVLTQNLPTTVFNASSSKDDTTQPKEAIIDNKVGSWTPSPSDKEPFLLIDLQKDEPVYGIELKGNPKKDEYVTSYRVLHSKDGVVFSPAETPELIEQTFRGPIDHQEPSSQRLEVPVEARYIKIVPLTWHEDISIRADVLGCGHVSTTAKTVSSTQIPTTIAPPICTDEMGPSSHPMSENQLTVSSSKDVQHDTPAINILKPSSWQPMVDSPTEWVEFDFLEPRNLTGFYTKGGDDGWVEAFNVKVSNDGQQWNPILDKNSREYVFSANYDNHSKVTNYFVLPVQARYIRLYPVKWHNTIQVKAEIVGCYKPYTTTSTVSTVATTTTVGTTKSATSEATVTNGFDITRVPCNYCPGVQSTTMELEACVCSENLWWNGTSCVTRPLCPCVVGSLTYPIGKLFNKEDCSECICKIGGNVNCVPKVCDKCEKGLKSTITNTCGCVCEPCHQDQTLCPTNNICLNSTLWCDGVIHCPDDEINCDGTGGTVIPKIDTSSDEQIVCPQVECPIGFKKVPVRAKHARYSSSRYASVKGRRRGVKGVKGARRSRTKGGVKGGHYRAVPFKLDSPVSNVQECVQYRCIAPPPPYQNTTEECTVEDCPAGYQKVDEEMVDVGNKQCPMLVCVPLPVPDSVCNITGRTFVTFDGTEYRYDICDHVLARDLPHNDWAVILSKNCTETCSRDLHVYIVGDHFIFHPDLSVEYNGRVYTTDQLRRIGRESNAFTISKVGNVVAFNSLAHGFWIEWNSDGNAKIGVVHSLTDKVDGLCGYFDNNINNDKRKPNGDLAKTTSEFGDSWSIEKTRPACKINTCPSDIQNKAWQLCNTIRDDYLSSCSNVVDLDASVSRCLDTACECLLTSTKENVTNIGKCKCQLLQSFVVNCLTSNPEVEISGWRGQYDCPSNCPAPLVYKDCFQRECEPSCESLSDSSLCPKVDHACYPGCYCPAELVRKGDKCIKPSECRDCECKVTGPLDFLTYDESNFTIAGNCVYVLTKDIINDKKNDNNFQVLITNGPCAKENKTCIKKVTVLYGTHTIHVSADSVNVDSQELTLDDYGRFSDWIKIKQNPTKGVNLLLLADQVEINIEYPSLGVTVRAPSYKYGGKLEGLCGDCNKNPDDDLRLPNGTITEDVEEFSLSWLYDGLPEKQTKEQCKVKPVEKCKPLPDSQNPCVHLLDEYVFGACHPVVDYSIYQQWCNKETCVEEGQTTDMSLVCPIIESYAKECAKEGICVNWHFDMCPQSQCTDGKVFSACGSSCPVSCDSINNKEQSCVSEIVEGCFCPEGKVLKGDVCVPERECIDCDAEGHHPGDRWVKDICTNCTCEGRNVLCQKKECPAIGTICEQGFNPQKVIRDTEECCDKYTCVPEPTTPTPCSTPQPLVCGEDKQSKLSKKDDGCYQNICECIPKDQCKPIDLTTSAPLEDGYKKVVDETDCCAKVKLVCKPELCSAPPKCQEFYVLKTQKEENKCCPAYTCLPPDDKCIFENSFIAAEKGGERPRNDNEKQKYLKNPSETWTDGPCRECQCQQTPNGEYQNTCSLKQCPSLEKFADYNDYELAPEWVYNQCCSKFVRTACKVKGKTYNLNDEWVEGEDYCTVYKCANNTDGGIIKEVHVTKCDTNCSLGYEYEPAAPGSKKCCGTCNPVACVINDIVRRQDEEWVSPDYCIHYKCLNVYGTMQVTGKETTCSKVPPETLKNYVVNVTKIDGECCSKTEIVACKENDQVRQIGETWKADDDVCKELKCSRLDESHLAITEYLTTCNTTCPAGYSYTPAERGSGRCCGMCQQTACVVDGIVREVGEHWESEDFCTKLRCISEQETLQVEKKITKCKENSASLLESYVVKSEKVPGHCCNKSEVVACKANGNIYKAGDTWIVGTDYCKNYKCITVDGGLAITATQTKCNTTCPNGFDYVESSPEDATCCGECIQAACIVNGTVRQVDERWVSSDYCHKYRCEKTDEALQIATTKIECKPPDETLKRFVVNSNRVPGKCCNHSEIVGCRGNDLTYDIGDSWIEGGNYCQKFECIKANGKISIREYVTQCNATCPLGFEYEPASKEDAKCCGSCQQVQCVVDGKVWDIKQEWESEDHCSKFKCNNISGAIQVETRNTVCQSPSLDSLKEYVIVRTPVEGQCCPTYKEVACKFGNETYKIGETWPTDDHCKNITCSRNDQGQLVKKELIESCKEYCDKGYQYVPSNETCCGTCVEVACVFNGLLKQPGEMWPSLNGCTNYTCEKNGELMIVSAHTELCPNVDDCPIDHLYDNGCCKKCNATSENQLSCAIENVPLDDTVKLIKTENIQHGVCVNKEPITNLTQCVGSCESSTLFDIRLGKHTSVCTCCQALQYSKIAVPVVCDDGFTYEKHIEVPSVCRCNGCQGGLPQLARLKGPSKSGRKTSRYHTKTPQVNEFEPEAQ